jgi:hypothetical protein
MNKQEIKAIFRLSQLKQTIQQFPILLSTDINDKTPVVRASCPHQVYLTQAELAVNANLLIIFNYFMFNYFMIVLPRRFYDSKF